MTSMANVFPLILCLFAGAGIGVVFFEGLWRTVSKAAAAARPIGMLALSFAVRATFLSAVLWLVSRGDPFRITGCMVGFFMGRTVILRIHRKGKEIANQP